MFQQIIIIKSLTYAHQKINQVKVDREDEDYDKYKVFVESTILQCLLAVIRFQRKFCLN